MDDTKFDENQSVFEDLFEIIKQIIVVIIFIIPIIIYVASLIISIMYYKLLKKTHQDLKKQIKFHKNMLRFAFILFIIHFFIAMFIASRPFLSAISFTIYELYTDFAKHFAIFVWWIMTLIHIIAFVLLYLKIPTNKWATLIWISIQGVFTIFHLVLGFGVYQKWRIDEIDV